MLHLLPPEIAEYILAFLSCEELCLVALVNIQLNKLCNDRVLWKALYRRSDLKTIRIAKDPQEAIEKNYYDVESGSVNWKKALVYASNMKKRWLKGEIKEVTPAFRAKSPAYAVCYDGDRVVIGCQDGKIKIFSRKDRSLLKCLSGHSRWIGALQYDDKKLVSCSGDCTVMVWDWEGNCVLNIGNQCKDWIKRVQYDEEVFVTAAGDGVVRVCRWSNPHEVAMALQGHSRGIMGLQFDQQTIISGSLDGTLRIWDRTTGQCTSVLHNVSKHGSDCNVRSVHFGDKIIVAGGDDKKVKIWDKNSGTLIKTLKGHKGYVKHVYFDGFKLVSAGGDGTIKIWDNRGTAKEPYLSNIVAHARDIIHMDIHDGSMMSASMDKCVKEFSLIS